MIPITAAVVRRPCGPFVLEELELDEPRDDELLVRIAATGICHTDLSIRDQYLPLPLPIVLGHEGAGTVERVGAGVLGFQPGDPVVLAPASCGRCRNCRAAHPMYCEQSLALNIAGRRPDGSATLRDAAGEISGAFFGQSSFATRALAHQSCAVRVPRDLPLEWLGPLGCSLQTGAGTVLNVLCPEPGSSLAIFGVGTVGLAALMAARSTGCATIAAIDRNAARLQLAKELGATHLVDTTQGGIADALGNATRRRGFDYAIDTTAYPRMLRHALECLASPGTAVSLGLAPAGREVPVDLNHLLQGRCLRGVTEGDSVPSRIIPALVQLWQQGRFPFERLIREYPLAEINQAAHDLQAGHSFKPVIRMP